MPVLTDALRAKIEAYIPRYPSKQAVTLPALHIVHDELRCVPTEAIREIADILSIPEATVKTRIHRAKAQLKDQLNPSGGVHVLV